MTRTMTNYGRGCSERLNLAVVHCEVFQGRVIIPISVGTTVVREMPEKITLALYYGRPWYHT